MRFRVAPYGNLPEKRIGSFSLEMHFLLGIAAQSGMTRFISLPHEPHH